MAQYAIAFDLDTSAMRDNGLTQANITAIYQTEIPAALAQSGFTAHPQGSLYHTESEQDPIMAVMTLQSNLQQHAANFCQYVRRVHVFRMEEWSDVTALISTANAHAPAQAPTPVEEIEAHDLAGVIH
jgi:virulence-associated protein VapD